MCRPGAVRRGTAAACARTFAGHGDGKRGAAGHDGVAVGVVRRDAEVRDLARDRRRQPRAAGLAALQCHLWSTQREEYRFMILAVAGASKTRCAGSRHWNDIAGHCRLPGISMPAQKAATREQDSLGNIMTHDLTSVAEARML